MRVWTFADVDQNAKDILIKAEDGEMQVIGIKDRLPIVILPFDILFEPDRSKWDNFKLNISDSHFNYLAQLAEEKGIALNDLMVLLVFEFTASQKLDAFRNSLNDANAPKQGA